jgi:hypothetical protein
MQLAVNSVNEFDTLVIDTLNGIERLYFEWLLVAEFGGSPEKFTAYGRDKTYPHVVWQYLLRQLDFIQSLGKTIVCLCHHDTKTFKNPEGPDYERFVPRLIPEVWKITFAWADVAVFANTKTYVKALDESARKGKAIGARERVLHTERSPTWDAKNRYRMAPEISMGNSPEEAYKNFCDAFAEAKNKNLNAKRS